MTRPDVFFFFDFLDPVSYLVARELATLDEAAGSEDEAAGSGVVWTPCELRPPPTPLTSQSDPSLSDRWALAHGLAGELDVVFGPPDLVPWTRKAHELAFHADSVDAVAGIRLRIFEAYLIEGRDIGRVDVLVELAKEAGMDSSEAKAVLDVDRYEASVAEAQTRANDHDVTAPPALIAGDRRLEGFQNRGTIGTFLRT